MEAGTNEEPSDDFSKDKETSHENPNEVILKSDPKEFDGPSNEREDISDDDFQDDSVSTDKQEAISSSDIVETANLKEELVHSNEDDKNESNNCSDISDAALSVKKEEIVDKNTDDLEAVSEDELEPDSSNAPLSQNKSQPSSNLEDLSSDDEEVNSNINKRDFNKEAGRVSYSTSEISQNSSEVKLAKVPDRLTSLEAEPISDEDDISQDEDKSLVENDPNMEAGEVHSPQAPTQPVEDLLREAEPISADESSDTDGELHSGDEDARGLRLKSNNDLEAIDSDEGDIGNDSIKEEIVKGRDSKHDADYMENISDEENLDMEKDKKPNSVNRDASDSNNFDAEKKQLTSNYSEHQEELDYEENEGDEGDMKPEIQKELGTSKDDDEDGELKEDGEDNDKDEGECSDDDCEEGEIKEPGGARKPFVKSVCRFFQRSHCTWGANCRFLHPGVNDKGAYQMIEIPGFTPPGARPPQEWEQQQEEPPELPPPPMPDIPHVETAWERGLRIAKEARKKASERKEKEPDFEEKRFNLKVEEEREVNKENEQRPQPKVVVKDPYYDQQAYEEDEYYTSKQEPWQTTQQYENFEVRYNRDHSFSPPYREKPHGPPSRYMPPPPPFNPNIDKFGRQMEERPKPFRPEPPVNSEYPSPANKRPDEWNDPWRRSKSPAQQKRKHRSRSRGKRSSRRSVSDSSNSSRSSSSSGSSRSSRSGSSSGSSSRSRSPEPAPPGVERHERYGHSPNRHGDGPRSAVSVRGRGGYNNYDDHHNNNRGHRGGRGRGRGGFDRDMGGFNHRGGFDNRRGGYNDHRGGYNDHRGGFQNRGRGRGYYDRNMRDPRSNRGHDRRDNMGRNRRPSPPDRPLPYVRPRRKSSRSRGSSGSSSSRSRSRSRSRSYSSRSRSRSGSRSSSRSSRSSSSSSSTGSADSDNLYRDLAGGANKAGRGGATHKKKVTSRDDPRSKGASKSGSKSGPPSKRAPPPKSMMPPTDLDRIPRPKDPKPSAPSSKYASQNAPQAPNKPKDPLKMVGLKSNIKLTLQPKGSQPSRGIANPLDSPPHGHQGMKRRISDRDRDDPPGAPPSKRTMLRDTPMHSQAQLKAAQERSAKMAVRQEQARSPPSSSRAPQAQSTGQRAKAATSPQKMAKVRPSEPTVGKPAPKMAAAAPPAAGGAKVKKSMSSRREELLKQLKAVEDAIQRKKTH